MKHPMILLAIIAPLTLGTAYATDVQDPTTTTQPFNQNQTYMNIKNTGDTFLQQNKTKEGVVTLPSGLQYKIIKEGTGQHPIASDVVSVHYAGSLIDGTEFDSSYKRGQPASFPVSGVIPGWVEALQLMKVGAEWELYIPSELAYGEHGAPPVIGPNEVLIFKVKLLEIKKA